MKRVTVVLAGLSLLAMVVLALAVPASAQAGDHCPDDAAGNDAGEGAPPGAVNGASGSITVDGVTVEWSGTSVTVSGGTATFCVKGGTSGHTGVITRAPGTYSTGSLGLTGPEGQSQNVSYLIVYGTSTTPSPTYPASPNQQELPPNELTGDAVERTFSGGSVNVLVLTGAMLALGTGLFFARRRFAGR